jgi:hypothetical protein
VNKYTCTGFRPVNAESAADAARIFATRQARRDYGSKGYCRSLRLDSWTRDGRSHTFETFIGRDVRGGACAGHDIWLFINRIATEA